MSATVPIPEMANVGIAQPGTFPINHLRRLHTSVADTPSWLRSIHLSVGINIVSFAYTPHADILK